MMGGPAALLGAVALTLLGSGSAAAHPLAPALLELNELGGGRVAVTWKTSMLRAPGVELRPALPSDCSNESEPVAQATGDALIATWTLRCTRMSLVGEQIGVDGLGEARIDALVRVTLADGRVIRSVVRSGTPRLTVPEREDPLDVVRAYLPLGFEHMITGLDHLLFVGGLLLLVRGGWLLLETITAFTVGHSITLSLAVLDLVRVPTGPIELLIALSVFLLAAELARSTTSRSLLRRRPYVMAFAFGLLHGLGFASSLQEAGLPQADVPLALASFNVGIELGQLAFVGVLLAIVALVRPLPLTWPRWAGLVPLYVMGSLSAFWCFERAAALIW
jgi:hypothetical protein